MIPSITADVEIKGKPHAGGTLYFEISNYEVPYGNAQEIWLNELVRVQKQEEAIYDAMSPTEQGLYLAALENAQKDVPMYNPASVWELEERTLVNKFTAQWLRDGEIIEGATSAQLTLTADDVGAQITVYLNFTSTDALRDTDGVVWNTDDGNPNNEISVDHLVVSTPTTPILSVVDAAALTTSAYSDFSTFMSGDVVTFGGLQTNHFLTLGNDNDGWELFTISDNSVDVYTFGYGRSFPKPLLPNVYQQSISVYELDLSIASDFGSIFESNSEKVPDGFMSSSITMGDIDNDRDIDIVISDDLFGGPIKTFLNEGIDSNGAIIWREATPITNPFSVYIDELGGISLSEKYQGLLDYDNDGDLDLITLGNLLDSYPYMAKELDANIYRNDAGDYVHIEGELEVTQVLVAADWDDNGYLPSDSWAKHITDSSVLPSFDYGVNEWGYAFATNGHGTHLYFPGDLEVQMDPFILPSTAQSTSVTVLRQNVNGSDYYKVLVSNFDQPSKVYTVMPKYNEETNSFDVSFTETSIGSGNTNRLLFYDFDRDGDYDDILALNDGRNAIYINEDGNYTDYGFLVGSDNKDTVDVTFFDFNGDGQLDLVEGNYNETDHIFVGKGQDLVFVGTQNADELMMNTGYNEAYLGPGDDKLTAGDGGSWINGGAGDDEITGGAGQDKIVADNLFSSETGADFVKSGGGDDVIFVQGSTAFNSSLAAENISSSTQVGTGENFNLNGMVKVEDVIDGGADVDTIQLGEGNIALFLQDSFSGFHASVALTMNSRGEEGVARLANIEKIMGNDSELNLIDLTSTDYSLAGQAITIDGAGGSDIIWGSDADEIIIGGDGNDELFGGTGTNVLTGGTGADEFQFTHTSQDTSVTDFDASQGDALRFYNEGGAEFDKGSVAANSAGDGIIIDYTNKNQTHSLDISLGLTDFSVTDSFLTSIEII